MTPEERHAKLVELGTPMLEARLAQHEALLHWARLAEEMLEVDEELAKMSTEEQIACFRESCEELGVEPSHPAFWLERESFVLGHLEEQNRKARLN